jgi:hypothetical protein
MNGLKKLKEKDKNEAQVNVYAILCAVCLLSELHIVHPKTQQSPDLH